MHGSGNIFDRTQTVSIDGRLSFPAIIHYGVPQGSVLRPIIFILYTQPLLCVIGRHPVSHQLYANDTQLYSSSVPSEISATIHNMEKCICNVKPWMICNKLQMNNKKMEAILIATQRTSLSHTLPSTLNINGIPIEFSKSLRNLGIIFANSFSLHQNIMNTCRAAITETSHLHPSFSIGGCYKDLHLFISAFETLLL